MSKLEFKNNGNGKEYKVKIISNSIVYVRKSEVHLLGYYYFVSWINYLKKKHLRVCFSSAILLQTY